MLLIQIIIQYLAFNNIIIYLLQMKEQQLLPNYDLDNMMKYQPDRFQLQPKRNQIFQPMYEQSKYRVDTFHNPYLSKFTLRLSPSTTSLTTENQNKSKFHFISPFNPTNNIYLSQSLPLYKSRNLRLSLIWKQSLKKKMGRGFIGFSGEYKNDSLGNIKAKAVFGSVFLYHLQFTKKLQNNFEAMFYHHGMYDNYTIAPVFGVGLRKNRCSVMIQTRKGLDSSLFFQYALPLSLPKNVQLIYNTSISTEGFDLSSQSFINTISLDYNFNSTVKSKACVSHYINERKVNASFEFEKNVQSFGKLLLNVQYRNNSSILYLGYKNPTLNLILPVCLIQSPVPFIIGAVAYVAGYFLRRRQRKTFQIKAKDQQVRIKELKLISDKANINYDKQESMKEKGLLIQQAFVGPSDLIDQLQSAPDRGIAILRDNKLKENIFDITMCLRFYVIKGELRLKKGDKNHLLGFYCHDKNDYILVKYKKEEIQKDVRIKVSDQLIIK